MEKGYLRKKYLTNSQGSLLYKTINGNKTYLYNPIYLLDEMFSGETQVAFSTFKLKDNADLSLRLRRTDNSINDIQLVTGGIDIDSVDSFDNGTNIYVPIWYDQSGNGNHATETTALNQPYLGGCTTKSKNMSIKNTNHGTRRITHPQISFTGNSFAITFVYKNNFLVSSRQNVLFIGSGTQIRLRDTAYSDFFNLGILYNNSQAYTKLTINQELRNYIGKRIIVTLSYENGNMSTYINGNLIKITSVNITSFNLSQIFSTSAPTSSSGELYYYRIQSNAMSESNVMTEYKLLNLTLPEMDSVKLNSQVWCTENFDAIVTPMGNIFYHVQQASTIQHAPIGELIDGGNGVATGLTLFNGAIGTIVTGNGFPTNAQRVEYNSTGSTLQGLRLSGSTTMFIGKIYKISFHYRASKAYSITDGTSNLGLSLSANTGNSVQYNAYLFNAVSDTARSIFFCSWLNASGDWFEIGDISVQEIGWNDLENLYNEFISNGDSIEDARKKCAAWCYYNNNMTTGGAIFGKLYNWYAVKTLQDDIDSYNMNNPNNRWGWKVPTQSDYLLLINNYGNNINIYKTTGINRYWKTDYDFGTNETGLSILGDGWRNSSTGGFTDTKFATFLRTQSAHYFRLYGNNNVGATLTVGNTLGGALRLIKNE